MTTSNDGKEINSVALLVDPHFPMTPMEQESIEAVEESLTGRNYKVVQLKASSNGLTRDSLVDVDVVFLQCYRAVYEHGSLQGLLQFHKTNYTGSKTLAAALASNRYAYKTLLQLHGIQVPPFFAIARNGEWRDHLSKWARKVEFPVLVRSVERDVLVEPIVVTDKKNLAPNIEQAFSSAERIIVESMPEGLVVVAGVLQTETGITLLPPVEVKEGEVLAEPRLVRKMQRNAQEMALQCHEIISAHGLSRCEMIVDRNGKLWAMEVDILPLLGQKSDFVVAARKLMLTYDDVIHNILLSAVRDTVSVEFRGGL